MTRLLQLGGLLLLGFVLTSCGGSDDSGSAVQASTAETVSIERYLDAYNAAWTEGCEKAAIYVKRSDPTIKPDALSDCASVSDYDIPLEPGSPTNTEADARKLGLLQGCEEVFRGLRRDSSACPIRD